MLTVNTKGDFSKTTDFLSTFSKKYRFRCLEKYGQLGVDALMRSTPHRTGCTSRSWRYEIKECDGGYKIDFCNSNIQNGVPIAIILYYGHATKNGSWVDGEDYITPALKPIFDGLAGQAWEEVVSWDQ